LSLPVSDFLFGVGVLFDPLAELLLALGRRGARGAAEAVELGGG